jgi:anti-anti-sigma factor
MRLVARHKQERMVVIPADLQATTTSEPGGRWIVRVGGELDLATAEHLTRLLDSVIRSAGAIEIIIDLDRLRFMDASGIRVLVVSHQLAQRLGRTVRVCNVHGEVDTILRLVGVAELVHLPEIPSAGSVSFETGCE